MGILKLNYKVDRKGWLWEQVSFMVGINCRHLVSENHLSQRFYRQSCLVTCPYDVTRHVDVTASECSRVPALQLDWSMRIRNSSSASTGPSFFLSFLANNTGFLRKSRR